MQMMKSFWFWSSFSYSDITNNIWILIFSTVLHKEHGKNIPTVEKAASHHQKGISNGKVTLNTDKITDRVFTIALKTFKHP